MKLPVAIPSTMVVGLAGGIIDPVADEGHALRVQSARLGQMRDLLLPRFMTGQINVAKLDLDSMLKETVG